MRRSCPGGWGIGVPFAMLLSSLYGFNREDAKTADHFFTGFPSYWNIVVFYLYLAAWPPALNAALLLVLALLVFVPIRYVYPSRTPALRTLTIGLGIVVGRADGRDALADAGCVAGRSSGCR